MFKAGDKVVCVRGNGGMKLVKGNTYVVKKSYEDMVNLEDPADVGMDGWYANRFNLLEAAKPVALVFAVGAEVERTGGPTILLQTGDKYIIETLYLDALGGAYKIKLQGINASYHVRGFKVVKSVFKLSDWNPVVGEQVYVVDKDKWHVAAMDEFINDGIAYVIKETGDQIRLCTGYVYKKSSLRPVNEGKTVKPPITAPKPPPEGLREASYEKQKKSGMGDSLCYYAFEEANGNQHFFPYICHARLSNEYGEIVKLAYGLRYDMARVSGKEKLEAHKVYSNYIISQSPWKDAFLTQDIDEAITKDIYMNVEVNRYVMAAACVALRSGQEYPLRATVFKTMLDAGHNPHTCWLIACAFIPSSKKGCYSFYSWTGGHDVIDKYRDMEGVIKFFQTGYHVEKVGSQYSGRHEPLTKDPYRTHHGSYIIADTIAVKRDGVAVSKSIGEWFTKNTKQSVIGDGWDKTTVIDVKALDDVATKLDILLKGQA